MGQWGCWCSQPRISFAWKTWAHERRINDSPFLNFDMQMQHLKCLDLISFYDKAFILPLYDPKAAQLFLSNGSNLDVRIQVVHRCLQQIFYKNLPIKFTYSSSRLLQNVLVENISLIFRSSLKILTPDRSVHYLQVSSFISNSKLGTYKKTTLGELKFVYSKPCCVDIHSRSYILGIMMLK